MGKVRHHHNIGDALQVGCPPKPLFKNFQGVELVHSGLDMKFKSDIAAITYCEISLDQKSLNDFLYAVEHHYW